MADTSLASWMVASPLARLDELSSNGYLDALAAYFQRCEPRVQAFLPEKNRFERLRLQAESLLKGYPSGGPRPPLLGALVGVKDIFRASGFETRAGSQIPDREFEGEEAESVRRLKEAGALILGKTVTTEFAYFAPGSTRNPHNPEYTPGGSSSGSAAAVGAGLCPLALGTQTIGSIIRPAAFCGVVGFKPSYDRISRAGVIPLAPSVDHVGLFTTSVGLVEVAASLLCDHWKRAPRSQMPVLGIPDGPYLLRASSAGQEHFWTVCQRLERAGYVLRIVPALPDFEEIEARHNLLVAAEAAQVHAHWFNQYSYLYHPRSRGLIEQGQSVPDESLSDARAGREILRDQLTRLMDEGELDLWISPPAPGPAPRGLESTGDPVMNLPWTHAGLPAINLPAGKSPEGLPMGLQIAGRFYSDEALLSWSADMASVVAA